MRGDSLDALNGGGDDNDVPSVEGLLVAAVITTISQMTRMITRADTWEEEDQQADVEEEEEDQREDKAGEDNN